MVNLIVPDDDSKVERDILSTVPTTILYLLIGIDTLLIPRYRTPRMRADERNN